MYPRMGVYDIHTLVRTNQPTTQVNVIKPEEGAFYDYLLLT